MFHDGSSRAKQFAFLRAAGLLVILLLAICTYVFSLRSSATLLSQDVEIPHQFDREAFLSKVKEELEIMAPDIVAR